MLIGITHSKDFMPVIRQKRVLKVGIGIPKGRAISVYIGPTGEWTTRFGVWEKSPGTKDKLVMKTVAKSKNRAEAEEFYRLNRDKAAASNRPQKIPFFTFTRRVVNEKAEESFEPDFATIEAHGPIPREIDIVLMSEDPWSSEYAWWSASELKCHGDGVSAMRVVSAGNDSMPTWRSAKENGEKYFAFGPCWTEGCPNAGKECKPNGTLNFQLANSMRIGATAYFTTTSITSCLQLFGGLEEIKSAAARVGSSIVGLPIKMVLSPFRSNHDGHPATQYGVSLELRAEDVQTLRQRLIDTAWRPAVQQAPRLIAEAPADEIAIDVSAASMSAEFYPEIAEDGEAEGESESAPIAAAPAAAATAEKTAGLAEKLKASAGRTRGNGAETQVMAPEQVAPPPANTPTGDIF